MLTPKNWATFQHYKDRKPPWIKLHRGLLDDYAFACLPLASQALAPRLWLLASEYEDGKITANLDEISFRLHVPIDALKEALKPLVKSGFFDDASGLLAECKQELLLEREEEREREDGPSAPSKVVQNEKTEEAELYSRGKQVLGKNAGGLIAKLLKSKKGNVALARAAIEQASTKQDPTEYIGRIVKGPAAAGSDFYNPQAGIL